MVGQCGSLEGVPVALLPPQEGSPPWVEGSHIGALVLFTLGAGLHSHVTWPLRRSSGCRWKEDSLWVEVYSPPLRTPGREA